jgi:hypothetical protein
MKHLLIGVYQVGSDKSLGFKLAPLRRGYIQVSDFRAIMALLSYNNLLLEYKTE